MESSPKPGARSPAGKVAGQSAFYAISPGWAEHTCRMKLLLNNRKWKAQVILGLSSSRKLTLHSHPSQNRPGKVKGRRTMILSSVGFLASSFLGLAFNYILVTYCCVPGSTILAYCILNNFEIFFSRSNHHEDKGEEWGVSQQHVSPPVPFPHHPLATHIRHPVPQELPMEAQSLDSDDLQWHDSAQRLDRDGLRYWWVWFDYVLMEGQWRFKNITWNVIEHFISRANKINLKNMTALMESESK